MTLLTGESELGPDGWKFAEAYVDSKLSLITTVNPIYRENARRYWTLASVNEAIRPEIAWAQHGKETAFGKFSDVVPADFCNPAGIKTRLGGGDRDPNAHQVFRSWDEGIRAHLNHLTAYAYGEWMQPIGVPHDRYRVILTTSWVGSIRETQGLDGKWAPSPSYGRDLDRVFVKPFMEWCYDLIAFFNSLG